MSISIPKLIFSRPIVLDVFYKCLNYDGMNLEMKKKCELQHILMFFWKNHWIWFIKMDIQLPFLV
jgi:hypothetical protein